MRKTVAVGVIKQVTRIDKAGTKTKSPAKIAEAEATA